MKLLPLVVAVVLLAAACVDTEGRDSSTTSSGELAPPPEGVTAHVDCIDNTLSVPEPFVEEVRAAVAVELEEYPSDPPFTSYRRFVRSIGAEDSFGPAGEIYSASLQAVGEEPALDPDANVFDINAQDQAEQEQRAMQSVWNDAIEAAREKAKAQADELRAVTIGRENRASDILGCIIKAQELMKDTEATEKHLLIASDLMGTGPQQDESLIDLEGVDVRVVLYCNANAAECLERRNAWEGTLSSASSLTFLDTSQLA